LELKASMTKRLSWTFINTFNKTNNAILPVQGILHAVLPSIPVNYLLGNLFKMLFTKICNKQMLHVALHYIYCVTSYFDDSMLK